MDKRREELEEQKADLHLALLMDEYAERMGKQVREEAEAAFERGELEMPPELDVKCRALISDAPAAEATKKPMRAVTRYALVAALSIVLLFGLLIAVQAAGIDVFGSIATWTDSVFHFHNDIDNVENNNQNESDDQIQAALRELGLPVELAPTWFPEGYHIQELIKDFRRNVNGLTIVSKNDFDQVITVKILHTDACPVDIYQIEKDDIRIGTYSINNRTFYLFSNESVWSGVWSDDNYYINISGVETEELLTAIIESINGG